MESVAFYAVADDGYVAKAVMALRSFQRWHPEFGYYLLGTEAAMSRESLQLMRRYDIELIDVDEAHQFMVRGRKKGNYPPEVFYSLKGPELLAERGFAYSVEVDGDVFAARSFDVLQLEEILKQTRGYAARPVGTLARTLSYKRGEKNEDFDFSPRTIANELGFKSRNIIGMNTRYVKTRYEPNTGVVFWNNLAMARLGLFEKCVHTFQRCMGCIEGDQDLLTLTSAIYDIPLLKVGHQYNFGFFEDSEWPDRKLLDRLQRGEFNDIYIVHFVYAKPWLPLEKPSPIKIHFINSWRKFVLEELKNEAGNFFEDVSPILPAAQRTGGNSGA